MSCDINSYISIHFCKRSPGHMWDSIILWKPTKPRLAKSPGTGQEGASLTGYMRSPLIMAPPTGHKLWLLVLILEKRILPRTPESAGEGNGPPHPCKHPSPRRLRGIGSIKYQGRCFWSWKSGALWRFHTDMGRSDTQNKCVFCVLSGHKDWAGGKRKVPAVAQWGAGVGSELTRLWLLTIPWVMSQLSMGCRSESPPLPLCWAKDRKVPKRKVIPHIVREKSLFRLDHLSHKAMWYDASHPCPNTHPAYMPGKREGKFNHHIP